MSANDKQVAGDHYKVAYQHWDMLVGVGYTDQYFAGQVTKYITRWKKKNGVRDILKGQHFAQKLLELVQQKGEKFLMYGGTGEKELEAVIRMHMELHLNDYFKANEVGEDERAICVGIMFCNSEEMLNDVLGAIGILLGKARGGALDKLDAETPVSRDFEFMGYEEDKIGWRCKKCGHEMMLPLDRPPTFEHKQCESEETRL